MVESGKLAVMLKLLDEIRVKGEKVVFGIQIQDLMSH